jgi:hypothetical protein
MSSLTHELTNALVTVDSVSMDNAHQEHAVGAAAPPTVQVR